jgi:hypothetical protein
MNSAGIASQGDDIFYLAKPALQSNKGVTQYIDCNRYRFIRSEVEVLSLCFFLTNWLLSFYQPSKRLAGATSDDWNLWKENEKGFAGDQWFIMLFVSSLSPSRNLCGHLESCWKWLYAIFAKLHGIFSSTFLLFLHTFYTFVLRNIV